MMHEDILINLQRHLAKINFEKTKKNNSRFNTQK